jgi:hypothetical protein
LALNLSAEIYGFGSYFKNLEEFRDIDILIVHGSNSHESCLKAISIKRAIFAVIDGIDVSMLSKSEEQQFGFIDKSQAILLYKCIGENGFSEKILLEKINAHRRT